MAKLCWHTPTGGTRTAVGVAFSCGCQNHILLTHHIIPSRPPSLLWEARACWGRRREWEGWEWRVSWTTWFWEWCSLWKLFLVPKTVGGCVRAQQSEPPASITGLVTVSILTPSGNFCELSRPFAVSTRVKPSLSNPRCYSYPTAPTIQSFAHTGISKEKLTRSSVTSVSSTLFAAALSNSRNRQASNLAFKIGEVLL